MMANKIDMTLQTNLTEGTATLVDTRTTTVDDLGITKQDSGVYVVAANVTDQALSLAGCDTAKYLHAEFSAGCTVKLNSTGATGIVFTPIAGQPALLSLAGCAVTALYVTNPAGVALTVRLVAAQ